MISLNDLSSFCIFIISDITQEEVNAYFGEFTCHCVAWGLETPDGELGEVQRSDRAIIKEACKYELQVALNIVKYQY